MISVNGILLFLLFLEIFMKKKIYEGKSSQVYF